MNHITYRISLDMFDTSSQTTIKAKKGDSACKIQITLAESGKIYKIGEGCSATFNAKKSDGNFIYDNCAIEDNTIVYDFTSSIKDGIAQISACEGIVECEVTLYNATGEQLTSPRFTLVIDGTVYNGEEIISTSVSDVFEKKENKVETLFTPSSDLNGKYPSATAVQEYVSKYVAEEIKVKADKTALDNKVDKEEVSNNFANAIKGTTEGNLALLDDVSPIEHNLDVKVKAYNKTLSRGEQIPITTYLVCGFGGSYETNGVTHNVDADGTIRTSGIYDNSMYYMPFMIYCPPYMYEECSYKLTEGATYEFRCLNEKSTDYYADISITNADGTASFASYRDYGDGVIFTVPDEPPASGAYYLAVIIDFAHSGFNTDGLTFNPKFYNYIETVEEVEPVGVNVEVYGKNLFKFDKSNSECFGRANATVVEKLDNGVVISGGGTTGDNQFANGWYEPYTNKKYSNMYFKKGQVVTISAEYTFVNTDNMKKNIFGIYFNDMDNGIYHNNSRISVKNELNVKKKLSATYTISEDGYFAPMFTLNSCTIKIENIQVSLFSDKEYEPYKEPITYTPNADGIVDGVKSISPSMTIFTDSDDCVLNVGYNIDTKRYIDKKFAELQALLLEV